MNRLPIILLALSCLAATAAPKPHIVYILADDMGYADPGFMGSTDLRTPHLDRIARGGTILSSYYVQPVCSPTRATLMTGRYATRTGVYSVIHPHEPWGLPAGERTLAEALRDAGYETAICGKWHLGEFAAGYLPTRRGFDHQYGMWFGAIDYFTHKRGQDIDWHRDDKPCDDEGYSTHLIAQEACRLIRERNRDKPLFLYLPFNAVHSPHQVPARYTEPFARLSGVRKTYAGMVAAMDEAIGQVVAALEEAKMRDDTLIIFSSDNGGPSPGKVTDNGPLRGGKGTLYEGGIRVCACVNWPGRIPGGKSVDEPLQGVDWYPTLVKLAGGSLDQQRPVDGRDIWPVLTAGAKSPHDALLLCGTSPTRTGLRMGGWKLIAGADAKAVRKGRAGAADAEVVELYHLADDIGERNNLAASNPLKVKELRNRLDAWMKDAVAPGSDVMRNSATKKSRRDGDGPD